MFKYVNRLMKCGYTKAKAYSVCCDFVTNLSIFDLENFILTMERKNVR